MIFGKDGITSAAGFNGVVVDMSTIPGRTTEIAADWRVAGSRISSTPCFRGEKARSREPFGDGGWQRDRLQLRALLLLEVVGDGSPIAVRLSGPDGQDPATSCWSAAT